MLFCDFSVLNAFRVLGWVLFWMFCDFMVFGFRVWGLFGGFAKSFGSFS